MKQFTPMENLRLYDAALARLRRAMVYLAEQYETGAIQAVQILSSASERVDHERGVIRAGESVGVYRQHQPLYSSPCELGDPCEVCQAHLRRRKQNTICPLAKLNQPAFMTSAKQAIALMKDGMAVPGPNNSSIVLTFSKIAQLRDRSLKIDERFMENLVADHFPDATPKERRAAHRARQVVNGWTPIYQCVERPPDERVLSFQK